jgi:hypothetical protein
MSSTFQVKEMSSGSSSKFCTFIYSIFKEIENDDEGFLLVVDLLDRDFSLEDISEFVMKKFLKNICNNYSFEINEINNPILENDKVIEDDYQQSDNQQVNDYSLSFKLISKRRK